MKTTTLWTLGICGMLVAGARADVQKNAWKAQEGTGVTGAWNDAANWSLGRVPADGDDVSVAQPGVYAVSLPKGVLELRANQFRLTAGGSSDITLDGRGGVFSMPAAAEDVYGSEPFSLRATKGHFFNLETYSASSDRAKQAVVTASNALLRVQGMGDIVRMDVASGDFNFYDPSGVFNSGHNLVLAAYGQENTEIYVHGGANLRLPDVSFRGNAWNANLLSFSGGRHTMNNLQMPSGNFTVGVASTTEVRATDGADVTAANVTLGAVYQSGSTETSSNRTFRLVAEKGAAFKVTGNVNHAVASAAEILVRDGGSLAVGGTLSLANGANVTSRLEVADAALDVKGLRLGAANAANGFASAVVSNSTLTQTGGSVDVRFGELRLVEAEAALNCLYLGYGGAADDLGAAVVDGGRVTSSHVHCGLNSPGALTVRNGAAYEQKSGAAIVGKDAGTVGTLTVEDAGTTVSLTSDTANGGFVKLGDSGTGVLEMKGGTLAVPTAGLCLGCRAGSTGVVNQTGGVVSCPGNEGLMVGMAGAAVYNMAGGELVAERIRFNWTSAANVPTSVLHQTGGTISVLTTEGSKGVNVCDSKGTRGRLILDGGVLKCHQVRGWTGAAAKDGGGWAVLEADGGAIRATAASAIFVENFDEAVLGEKGLTLISDYAVTASQNFTSRPGARGRLVLAGNGVKTLTGAASREAALDVAGGTARVAADRPETWVTVTNAATLSFAGDLAGAAFAGLTLGDAVSGGFLEMDLSDRIDLAAEPAFGSFSLLLTSAEVAAGTYPLITCPGDQTGRASAKAWANGYLASGRAEGLSYAFAASYDAAAGRTSYSLVVAEGAPLAETATWKGDGAAWGDDANWEGGAKPGARAVARFASETAPGTVTVAGVETVGALAFAAEKGYAVTGGTLALAETGYAKVEATQGEHTIASALALPSVVPFHVVDPAALTLAGAAKGGGVLKTGTGRLYLEAEGNAFPGSVRVEAGLLSAASAGALGKVDVGLEPLTLVGGTLELQKGVTGVLPRSLVVQTPEAGQATVLKVDADVVLTGATVVRGDLIKRGAGTLTFDVAGDALLSVDNGTCAENALPSGDALSFPANGVPPSKGYAGFNVADGEVVLKGGVYSIPNAICVGLRSPDLSGAEPAFTVDGATVKTGAQNYHFLLGPNAYEGVRYAKPRLTVKNGGYLSVNTLNVARGGAAALAPEILLDNGTLLGTWCLNISCRAGAHPVYTVRNGSKMLSQETVNWNGPATLTFTDSVFARDASLAPTGIKIENVGEGTWLFGPGAEFRCNGILQKTDRQAVFAFAGGRWTPNLSNDFDFLFERSDRLVVETRAGGGLTLGPPAGRTWRLAKAVTGAGGLTMDGLGTLRFVTQEILQDGVANKVADAATSSAVKSPYTLDFAGALDVVSGTVVVEEGAARPGAVFTGAGTLVATNCAAPVLRVAVDAAGAADRLLTLADFSAAGGATVDLGRTADDPLARPFRAITVARYTGAAPDVSGWKLAGTGLSQVKGAFSAADGEVRVLPRMTGCTVILR